MFEIQRPSQLPSPAGTSLPLVVSPAAGTVLRPVEPPAQLRGPAARHGGQAPGAQNEAPGIDVGSQPRSRRIDPESLSDDAARGRGGVGRLAFLTQQIFQEHMPSGLHLEPWARGIGAYLRAGAEPATESAAPAAVSFCV